MTKWHVTLLPIAESELMDLPADMRAKFLHIAELLEELGPHNVGMPHIRHLEDKLWEMRMTGRGRHCTGDIRGPQRQAVGSAACIHQENPENPAQKYSHRP